MTPEMPQACRTTEDSTQDSQDQEHSKQSPDASHGKREITPPLFHLLFIQSIGWCVNKNIYLFLFNNQQQMYKSQSRIVPTVLGKTMANFKKLCQKNKVSKSGTLLKFKSELKVPV